MVDAGAGTRRSRGRPARIANTIRLELALYLLILLVAMTLTLTTPPRAIVQTGAGPAAANPLAAAMAANASVKGTLQANGYSAEYELTPGKPGENMLMVTVKGADGKVLENLADLEIVPSLPSAGIGDIRIKASKQPGGMWHAMVQEMIIPGQWTLGLDVFVTDYDKIEIEWPGRDPLNALASAVPNARITFAICFGAYALSQAELALLSYALPPLRQSLGL